MSDELGHLHGILEALQLLGLLYPGRDLPLLRRPVEGAVDLHGVEELRVVGEPVTLFLGQLDRVEPAHPVTIGPAAAANADHQLS